jgi:hypothetical protein
MMTPKLLNTLKKEYKQDDKSPEYPDWVLAGPPVTKKLYTATNTLFIELKQKIELGDIDNIDIHDGPIVKAHIAECADVSATNIRIDRQVDLFNYIEEQNIKLTKILKTKKSKKSSGKRKTKKQIEEENKILKLDIKKLEQEKYHDFFTQIIASQLMKKQKDLALQNQKLLEETTHHEETIRNLRRQISQYMKQFNNT